MSLSQEAKEAIQPSERRYFERFVARYPIKFKDSRQDFGSSVFLRDISAEGLRLLIKERVYLNDSLSFEVELPDGQSPLVLSGQVVWAKPHDSSMWHVGLKFHKVNLMKLHRLFKYSS